ncbi:MAG: hypothetical protein PHW52_04600, partial [Candidatus Pacebacteria bacterium]|nr:hypothetical protein [Candidatus Paceibacterota bacterium]
MNKITTTKIFIISSFFLLLLIGFAEAATCGSSNGISTVTAPTTNLCSDGSLPHVSASGNRWAWTCGTSSCSAIDPNASYKAPFAASEMPTYTGAGSSPDTAEVWLQWFCSSGFPSQAIYQNYEQVSCTYGTMGSHGGCPGCVMSKFTIRKKYPINGQCGSSNGGTFSSAPTTGLCNSGTPSSISGSGPWTWTCTGLNGGRTSSCFANKAVTCGSSNGISTVTAPTTNLCSDGSLPHVSASGNRWAWTCGTSS